MSLEDARIKKKSKMRNRLIFRSIVLAILIGAVVFALVTNAKDDNTVYKVGDQAPDFHLQQVNENNELVDVKLSDFEGKGVMLNFWATFCDPCEEEMPYMEELYPEYQEKGVEIIAVSLDATEIVIDRFIDKHELTFPIPHDTKNEVMDAYNVGPIPSTLFIDANGKIVERVEGALTLESLESHLKEIQPEP
ncbi:MAG TPA: thiol-disulfide oxidoreductase ResA [Virgibacillus sp.]|nr:thiol-disulfide oxidoreductase ResA [Virgibacillus sp.]